MDVKKIFMAFAMIALVSFSACDDSSSASQEESAEISSSSDALDSAKVVSSSSNGCSSSSESSSSSSNKDVSSSSKGISSSSNKDVSSSSEEFSSSSVIPDSVQVIIEKMLGKCDADNDGEKKPFDSFGLPIIVSCNDGMWLADSAATMEKFSCDEEGALDSINVYGAKVFVVCENGYFSMDSSKVSAVFQCTEEQEGEWFTRNVFGMEMELVCKDGKLETGTKVCTDGETKTATIGVLTVEMICKNSKWFTKENTACTAENIGEETVVWGGMPSVCTENGWVPKRPDCDAEHEGELWKSTVYGMEFVQVCKDGEWLKESIKACEDGETKTDTLGSYMINSVCVNGMWEAVYEP